jgi:ketosteroid isomerase-like protein
MSTTTIIPEMREVNRTFDEVMASGDVAALGRVYARDAQILPPGAEPVRGLEEIQNFWKSARESLKVTGCTLNTLELQVQGDMAYEVGRADLTTSASSALIVVKYVIAWRRMDGAWRWHVDIWNTNS